MEQAKLESLRVRHPKLDLPGFECGGGWFEILDKLCTRLDSLTLPDTFRIDQIKEKFGELRFYVSGIVHEATYSTVMRWIADAAEESVRTCEICGRSGRRRPLYWVITLCWWHYLLLRWRR